MKKIITILIVTGVLGLIAFRLLSNKRKIDAGKKVVDTSVLRVAVNTAPVESRVSEKNLVLVGTVIPNQEIEIKSEVQGQVVGLYVSLGDFVPKGKVIAKIDDQIRQIAVANAEQKLADAKQNLVRYEKLYKGGAATKAQYEQYKLASDNAYNQLEQARKELSNAVIKAPFGGYITKKSVEVGAFANIGTSLVNLVDISKLKVQLNVPEADVYTLTEGDPVQITSTVFPGVTFEGKITFVSPRGDEAHNYPIEISIGNQSKNQLKAGTYVDIAFNRKSHSKTLQIPREALVGSIRNAQVYVVDSNNVALLRTITLGEDNGNYLEVIRGLKEGEKVVTTGHINLADSMQVDIIK